MLYTHPAQTARRVAATPALWICAPRAGDGPLSADVECLHWQAYLGLRGVRVALRTDINAAGALDHRLPNLHAAPASLLPAHRIPEWADQHVPPLPPASDESLAWTALLQGPVHAALLLAAPTCDSLFSLRPSLPALLTPPPPPATGLAALFPPLGARISPDTIYARYDDAIAALSDRLAADEWFLGSTHPTSLDALVFAYLHAILASTNPALYTKVTQRVNLVAWERRVREQVCAAFN